MSKAKRNSLLLLSTAGILTLLLAMSVPTLVLSPGEVFSPENSKGTILGSSDSFADGEISSWTFRGFMTLVFVLFSVYIIYSLFSAEGRRRLGVNLTILAILLMIVYYFDKHPLTENAQEPEMPINSPADDLNDDSDLSAATFSGGEVPTWLVVGIILGASALSTGLLVAGLRFFRQPPANPDSSLHQLAEAAQNTFESLQAGGSLETAIIRCYHEMNRVVKEQRGIARETAMTPREFEVELVSKGLPHTAVETLTRLFERVRYGSVSSGTGDETTALACLTEIINTCSAVQNDHDK
ncbi:MAG: DUF4129 domain-containing protein [Anaerolineales bacterium]|nr:DUF4129 domain-containing protein [Anaerolineales bacterium]